jgi:cyclic pyranopterin phosphate synthase
VIDNLQIITKVASDVNRPAMHQARSKTLTNNEYILVIKAIHALSPLDSVTLTGGEPLLYGPIGQLIEQIRQIGINNVSLTTNGFYLENKAVELKESGISSINVSLDALDEETFKKMANKPNLAKVLKGIDAALALKIKIKINAVIMRDINHEQIVPLLEYGISKGIKVRFLELMSMGHLFQKAPRNFFSQQEILDTVSIKYKIFPMERKLSSTANYWQVGEIGYFGIIANESSPFCHDCNRLRLDSSGNIYGCISSQKGIDIKPAIGNQMALEEALKNALSQKQPVKFTGSPMVMREIGG